MNIITPAREHRIMEISDPCSFRSKPYIEGVLYNTSQIGSKKLEITEGIPRGTCFVWNVFSEKGEIVLKGLERSSGKYERRYIG